MGYLWTKGKCVILKMEGKILQRISLSLKIKKELLLYYCMYYYHYYHREVGAVKADVLAVRLQKYHEDV